MPHEQHLLDAVRVTELTHHHFFGYYDKHCWDATGRYLLGLRALCECEPVTGVEVAQLGLMDSEAGPHDFQVFDETRAFCWQQANMLQWTRHAPDREIIYNQLQDDRFVSILRDVHTGASRTLPRPVYCLSPDGRTAASVNFARIGATRPGYGYPALPDPWANDPMPDDDGLYVMDLETGDHRLVLSYAAAAEALPGDYMEGSTHWFNHVLFNTDGTRICLLHRGHRPEEATHWWTRCLTCDLDGGNLHLVSEYERFSHYDWRDERTILGWLSPREGAARAETGPHYYHLTDQSHDADVVGDGVLDRDGHCSYSPDGRWILTDCYPGKSDPHRTLILYRPEDNLRVDIAHLYSPPELAGECRCDLHPRWSRDGRRVCIDSAHEGVRAIYVLDASLVLDASPVLDSTPVTGA